MMLSRLCSWLLERIANRWRALLQQLYRPRFGACGEGFEFDPMGQYTFSTIFVGHHVSLGKGACLVASRSRILIGNHVIFGPFVTIRGGNHRVDILGRFMSDIRDEEKKPQDDPGVIVEDDVWVGTRAIILAGVKIGRGAVVGAGAVVTRDVPPYGVVVGNPARLLRFRWNVSTILEHERLLYPLGKRFTEQQLDGWRRDEVRLAHDE